MHGINFGKMAPESLTTTKLYTTERFNAGCGLLHRRVRTSLPRFLKLRIKIYMKNIRNFKRIVHKVKLPEYGSSIAQPPVLADRIRSFLRIVGMISKPKLQGIIRNL